MARSVVLVMRIDAFRRLLKSADVLLGRCSAPPAEPVEAFLRKVTKTPDGAQDNKGKIKRTTLWLRICLAALLRGNLTEGNGKGDFFKCALCGGSARLYPQICR